jgi:CheY-like chemotaxis protein
MDGHDLLREVRRRPPEEGGSTPAIALSAYVSPEDRRLAMAVGFEDQVSKPVEVHDLIRAIRRLVATGGTPAADRLTASDAPRSR